MIRWFCQKSADLDLQFSKTDKSRLSRTRVKYQLMDDLFVCLFALRPKSTAMVIAGRSVHLTTLFSWASLNKQLTSNRAHTFACN